EFAARQRYVEDVVAPPTVRCLLRNRAVSVIWRSYQTTCNLLKKRDFVGADRAAFRLSANTVFQAMNIRRMYWPFRGQVH
ncbi:hypothetical protein, partial [Pseudomonas viridiflava]